MSAELRRKSQGVYGTAGLAGVIALSVTGCLTDGPNRTGEAYLREMGITLNRSVDSAEVRGFAADTFWTEMRDGPIVGSAEGWWLGDWGDVHAEARLGFPLDSSDAESTETLEIRPVLKTYTVGQAAITDPWKDMDSVRLTVTGFFADGGDDADAGLAEAFFLAWDTLPAVAARAGSELLADTLWLELPADSSSWASLRLSGFTSRRDRGRDQRLFLHLGLQGADSTPSPGILRFNGQNTLVFEKNGTDLDSTRVFGLPGGFGAWGMRLVHSQPMVGLISGFNLPNPPEVRGFTQGLRFHLDREKLLGALEKNNPALKIRSPQGRFDDRYFIALCEITFHLDTGARIEGDFLLDVGLASSLDSLPEPADGKAWAPPAWTLILGEPVSATPGLELRNSITGDVLDTLRANYFAVEGRDDVLRLAFAFSRLDQFNDTLAVQPQGVRYYALPYITQNTRDSLQMRIYLDSNRARVEYFSRPIGALEDFDLPGSDDVASNLPRYLKAGQGSLRMRASSGIQRLFNRIDPGDVLRHSFFLHPLENAGISSEDKARVSYPVLGEVPIGLDDAGRLLVDLKVHFYAL